MGVGVDESGDQGHRPVSRSVLVIWPGFDDSITVHNHPTIPVKSLTVKQETRAKNLGAHGHGPNRTTLRPDVNPFMGYAQDMRPAPLQQELSKAAAMLSSGKLKAAETNARALYKKNPRSVAVIRLLSLICLRTNKVSESKQLIEKCQKIKPGDPLVWLDSARICKVDGRFSHAVRYCRKALEITPKSTNAIGMLGQTLVWNGQYEEATKVLEPYIKSGKVNPDMLVAWIDAHHKLKKYDETIEAGEAISPELRTQLNPEIQRAIAVMLASSYEKKKRHEDAIKAIKVMHSVIPVKFNPENAKSLNTFIKSQWPKERFDFEPETKLANSEVPVFVISMPRSGTTLLERIIAAHPQAHGAGECRFLGDAVSHQFKLDPYAEDKRDLQKVSIASEKDVELIRDRYMRDLVKLTGRHDRIVNKDLRLPRMAGIVGRCFPKARIICPRRNPEDLAVSIWSHAFRLDGMAWTTQLEWIAEMLAEHERLMDYWQEVLPNPWLNIEYEELAGNPEPHVRELIDFLGLPWDDACLSHQDHAKTDEKTRFKPTFSEHQVRQAINTSSVGRAEGYREVMEEFSKHYEAVRSKG